MIARSHLRTLVCACLLVSALACKPADSSHEGVVERGEEDGGVRYASPEGGFSAVFPARPEASKLQSRPGGGTILDVHAFLLDHEGLRYDLSCVLFPPGFELPEEIDIVTEQLRGAGTSVTGKVELQGVAGLEGEGPSGEQLW
ncbi:hypothetical protein [Plesiocystis pacifica]|uniref:hypothetical protein n=1 Tax=Plesiocystis pacifica TaxID=191768 RepID=UPI0002FE27CB|nr:hypothetical protein [Plesiocystis pacifica]